MNELPAQLQELIDTADTMAPAEFAELAISCYASLGSPLKSMGGDDKYSAPNAIRNTIHEGNSAILDTTAACFFPAAGKTPEEKKQAEYARHLAQKAFEMGYAPAGVSLQILTITFGTGNIEELNNIIEKYLNLDPNLIDEAATAYEGFVEKYADGLTPSFSIAVKGSKKDIEKQRLDRLYAIIQSHITPEMAAKLQLAEGEPDYLSLTSDVDDDGEYGPYAIEDDEETQAPGGFQGGLGI